MTLFEGLQKYNDSGFSEDKGNQGIEWTALTVEGGGAAGAAAVVRDGVIIIGWTAHAPAVVVAAGAVVREEVTIVCAELETSAQWVTCSIERAPTDFLPISTVTSL